MSDTHQSKHPGEWWLGRGAATRLDASAAPRWLVVNAGRAWITRTGAGPYGDDVWLSAGERLALPEGSEWVIEAAPHARLMLLQPPVAAAKRGFTLGAWRLAA